MPPSTCLRCLPIRPAPSPRPVLLCHIALPPAQTAAFSTTTNLSAAVAKKRPNSHTGPPKRGVKALNIKKTQRIKSGRPPAPGERKALRKRIVLSNTNALEVQGMPDLSDKNITDASLVCRVVGIPGLVVDSLRAVEAFKPTQGWGLFRRPAALVRKETLQLGRYIQEVETAEGKKTIRRVVVGERGSGKSTLLLQAMTMAFVKGWVVVNIPDAKDLTIGHTEYGPLFNTNPTQYVQKTYTANLLSQISKANKAVLSKLQLSQQHDLPIPIQSNISLDRLADLGARDPDVAYPIFQALWAELTAPSTKGAVRPPILFTLDGINQIMRYSAYLSSDVKPIHAHDLALVRHFINALSGAQALPNGGIVLAATCESGKPPSPTLELAVAQSEARVAGAEEVPQPHPYKAMDQRVLDSMRDVEVLRLKGLDKDEARGIMEYYAASGMLRERVDEGLVAEKWTLAGGGVVGELERESVRMRI
ncbi:hypothetical protein B0A49_05208 [Cryomyces minteri]|uniref:Small ribosomal subunit protein mS29 n=1 Tax=Cryomyces minteri TaxID=331657 RepID=A0A4U0X013_9PEZI|nr:hypothetical protein B0A49_05208 [Cryomyces minteri]